MDLIYTDSDEINTSSWERIIHSLITFGKAIWINENITFSRQLPDWIRKHYIRSFNELKEEKIIKIWNYEQCATTNSNIDIIIPKEEIINLYDVISNQIIEYSPLGTLSQKDIAGNEITSKIIQYKYELWNFGIASILNVDGICYPSNGYISKGSVSEYYKYEQINRKYTDTIFNKLEIKPLGFLTTKDILDIQKQSKILVKKLSPFINNKMLSILPNEEIINNDCNALLKDFENSLNGLIMEKSLKKFGKRFVVNVIFTIGGLLFSPISFVSLGKEILEYFKNKRKNTLLLFTMRIKNKAYKSYMTMSVEHKDIVQYF